MINSKTTPWCCARHREILVGFPRQGRGQSHRPAMKRPASAATLGEADIISPGADASAFVSSNHRRAAHPSTDPQLLEEPWAGEPSSGSSLLLKPHQERRVLPFPCGHLSALIMNFGLSSVAARRIGSRL